MNKPQLLRQLATALTLTGCIGLGFAQTATPPPSPTVNQTVKTLPGMMAATAVKPSASAAAAATTTSQTVKPSSGNEPSTAMVPAGTASSPTLAQGVKPMSKREKAKLDKMNKSKNSSAQTGSGSAGNAVGRTEGSTNSNSDGKTK